MASHETPLDPVILDDDEPSRRDVILIAAGGFAAIGTAAALWPLLDQMNPDASTLSLATTEVDLAPIEAGQAITVMWRGKPIFIRHRTEKEIEEAKVVPLDDLIDPLARNANLPDDAPATDENRAAQGPRALARDDRHLHPSRLHSEGTVARPIQGQSTAAGSARATARNTTPPAACASVPRRRTWRSRLTASPPTPRSRSDSARSWRIPRPTSRQAASRNGSMSGCRSPRLVHDQFMVFPTPRNLNYWWTFGGILTFMLVAQIATGVVLAMHYVPTPRTAPSTASRRSCAT